ncbi:hypothetical protein [Nesterenkonia sp.]|uniref:hypothetical protein n=1 Tax=Nesterenkonia sp. TaxID=704201 RepID=UPI002615FF10|nr:hypothetical protein [Nesterenkonia sp.]
MTASPMDTAPIPRRCAAQPLPDPETPTEEGVMRLRRAWPVPGADEAVLAVELEQEDGTIRAGWWSRSQLQLLQPGQDPKLRTLADWADQGTVISHRPGKRAVVRLDPPTRYVKVVRRGKASGITDGIARAAAFQGPFRTPEVLESTDSTVTFSAVEGRSLHHAEEFTHQEWTQAWCAVTEAWRTGASAEPQRGTKALVHRAEAEAGVLRHWHQLVSPWLPDAAAAERTVERVVGLLRNLPEEQLRPAHRDLHDKQLLYCREAGPGLLDVDTACLADPALDLGNLRAHAALRQLQGLWSRQQAETVSFCVDETAEQLSVPRGSAAVYEQAALLRLGFVYAVRPQYADVAARLRRLVSD